MNQKPIFLSVCLFSVHHQCGFPKLRLMRHFNNHHIYLYQTRIVVRLTTSSVVANVIGRLFLHKIWITNTTMGAHILWLKQLLQNDHFHHHRVMHYFAGMLPFNDHLVKNYSCKYILMKKYPMLLISHYESTNAL